MKNVFLSLLFISLFVTACSDDDTETITIDPTLPTGTFNVTRSGSFVEQNGTGSAGLAELGTDADGDQFLRFGDDFMTNLGTGTVTVYFSTSDTFTPDPDNGNPDLRLVGAVSQNGENFYLIEPGVSGSFTHVILWCGSASIPFGYAELN